MASCFTIRGVDDRSVKVIRIKTDTLLQALVEARDSDVLDRVRGQIDAHGQSRPTILLDRIPQELTPSPDAVSPTVIECERIANVLLRAMPTASIILASRFVPGAGSRFPVVELAALGEVECKRYVMSHPGGDILLAEPDLFDRLYSRSEGIPVYIDRMLEALHAASFEEVVSPSVEHDFSSDGEYEFFCASIRQLIRQMDGSDNQYMRRNVKMLKLLAMLTYGETFGTIQRFDFSSIRHFHQREPFYPANVTQLQHLHLIQSAPIVDIETSFRDPSRDATATSRKLLIVPKQVRDFVTHELISQDERREIAHRAADVFLGQRWGEGELSLEWIKAPDYNPSRKPRMALRSPFPVLLWMLQDEIERGDKTRLDRVLVAANVFLEAISDVARYRDLRLMSTELIRLLDAAGYHKEAAKSSYYLGGALRMLDRFDDAIDAHRRVLEEAEGVPNARRSWTHIELALCYEGLKNFEMASRHAETARELAESDSSVDFFARYILILTNTAGGDIDTKEKLRKLEAKARSKRCRMVADNIALTLAQKTTDPAIRIQIRNRVLANTAKNPNEVHETYNTTRAAVANAADMVNVGRAREVSEFDRRRLGAAYSYLYEQRMRSLFDTCHEALWQVEKSRHSVPGLVKLVQFGSSLWSVLGSERPEAKYIDELEAIAPQESSAIKTAKTSVIAHFFGGVLRRA
ncbi:tetratricopeptide repeat protein [Sorangium sp. So ce381]|uniref:tetratricopeptide repeat protein n=1 Tax=Sorangium sp. So ce381 TaxID=3133307 RepID=UPI003F5B551B